MTVFTSSPFNLVPGTLIKAMVKAHNVLGWSAYSSLNTVGVVAQTIPSQMAAPTRDGLTNTLQVVVDWTQPASDGQSPVLSYNLQWDRGT
jgi:hypothetical protein